MHGHIQYGDVKIAFTIRFLPRPQRRLAIHVLPDGAVCIDAPADATQDEVVRTVSRRARWIWQQLEEQRERKRYVLPREYVSGESHFYLGKRYVLKVTRTSHETSGVKLLRGRLEVTTAEHNPETVRGLLEDWYRQRSREVFAKRIAEFACRTRWVKGVPDFRLQNMRTQWGSCSPKGVLLLNPHLVKAPRPCVDYVIAHELSHLKERNHGIAFYRLLETLMPDWEERKLELDRMAEVLLNQ